MTELVVIYLASESMFNNPFIIHNLDRSLLPRSRLPLIFLNLFRMRSREMWKSTMSLSEHERFFDVDLDRAPPVSTFNLHRIDYKFSI